MYILFIHMQAHISFGPHPVIQIPKSKKSYLPYHLQILTGVPAMTSLQYTSESLSTLCFKLINTFTGYMYHECRY